MALSDMVADREGLDALDRTGAAGSNNKQPMTANGIAQMVRKRGRQAGTLTRPSRAS